MKNEYCNNKKCSHEIRAIKCSTKDCKNEALYICLKDKQKAVCEGCGRAACGTD